MTKNEHIIFAPLLEKVFERPPLSFYLFSGIDMTVEDILKHRMKELLLKLVRARIRPYYLYQCDLSRGIGHFRTRVEKGIEIIHDLTGTISGYAVPKFVIDAPGGGGKVPINPKYVLSMDDKQVVMENYRGDVYTYPQPADEEI
jgi:L-lysine 2,3-aminomutase